MILRIEQILSCFLIRSLTERFTFIAVAVFTLTGAVVTGRTTEFNGVEVPGVVVNHSHAGTNIYIGSPSIVVMPGGKLIATHDYFGSGITTPDDWKTEVFSSSDRGETWVHLSTIDRQRWSNIFFQNNALYAIGVPGGTGELHVRRSEDEGVTWTQAIDETSGIVVSSGSPDIGIHTSSVPTLVYDGRIWRGYETSTKSGPFPSQFSVGLASAPIKSDLLDASNWTTSNTIARDEAWLASGFLGWLEGNAVADRNGEVVNITRVDVNPGEPEVVAITRATSPQTISFDPSNDIVLMPGGSKKFSIRYHAGAEKYFSVTSVVYENNYDPTRKPEHIRNSMALISSPDLLNWDIDRIIVEDLSDVDTIGFQYMDWQFDGSDIVVLSRTAYPDGLGGPDSYHNNNFITFHRVAGVVPIPSTLVLLVIPVALATRFLVKADLYSGIDSR